MKATKRIISILLTAVMIVSVMSIALLTSSAATINSSEVGSISQAEFDNRLNSLRAEFPNYSTWNGTFEGATQCCGFAKLIANRVFNQSSSGWAKVYNIYNVKAGDIVQYGNTSGYGHTIFVTSVSGNTITFVDCNANGNYSGATYVRSCGVKWDNTVSKGANLFGYSFSYILSSPGVIQQPTEIFFDFWGTDTSVLNEVKGFIKLWFKAMNCDYNNSDVNVYVDDKCIGTIYPDSSGCYSIEINTNNYGNGQHKINAIFRNKAGVELKSSDLYISIKNPQILFWNLPQNSIKDTYKIWLKASNCNFEKSIVKLYIDDICVVEFLNGSDVSGYYSYNLNTYTLSNGNHNLVASYNDIDGVNMTTYVNKINVYNGYIIFWGDSGIDGNIIDTKTKYWFKAVDCDYINSQLDIYIDDTIYKTVYSDDSGYFSVYIDPFEINNGNHSIKAQFKNPAGLMLNTNEITFISINKIMGDLNLDGYINIKDATEIQKYIAQLITFDKSQLAVADINGDGKVDILDATQIQKYIAQLIDKLG